MILQLGSLPLLKELHNMDAEACFRSSSCQVKFVIESIGRLLCLLGCTYSLANTLQVSPYVRLDHSSTPELIEGK